MYSICFKSNRDHPCDAVDIFISYLSSLQLGTIYRVRRIPQHHGCRIFVHYSWLDDELLKRELNHGMLKTFIIGGAYPIEFDMVKTSVPLDFVLGKTSTTPIRQTSSCRIV